MVHENDVEFEEAMAVLSTPGERTDPGLSRRRFLQGALAAAATGVAVPLLRPGSARSAELATPLRPDEGVLVVLFLGGGNDGLNLVAPISGTARGQYDSLRGGLAVPAGALRDLGGGWGLHPAMGALHQRYRRGRVAVVEGVGLAQSDLSHFTATAKVMQGGASSSSGTGWLGRFLDDLPDGGTGLRSLSVGTSVPLFLNAQRSLTTAVPSDGRMWGADRRNPVEALAMDAVAAYADAPIGIGPWGERIASTGAGALRHAQTLSRVFGSDPGAPGLGRDLVLAARLINLDLGARVVGVTVGGFDTHAAQGLSHDGLLAMLDGGIQAFFATLASKFQSRVTMLVQSEFGRRPEANAALGTDHGTAAPALVIGENVRGGRHAAPPDLGRLDERGNVVPSVEWRSVYTQLLGPWLGADAEGILGGSFGAGLDLFAAGPGGARG